MLVFDAELENVPVVYLCFDLERSGCCGICFFMPKNMKTSPEPTNARIKLSLAGRQTSADTDGVTLPCPLDLAFPLSYIIISHILQPVVDRKISLFAFLCHA